MCDKIFEKTRITHFFLKFFEVHFTTLRRTTEKRKNFRRNFPRIRWMAPFRNLNERIKTTFWTQQTKKLIETKLIWSSSRHHFNKFYSLIHGTSNLFWFCKIVEKECSSHSNRFIRENSFYICSAVLNETLNSAPELIDDFAKLIYKGLSDNWSQVRMSSSAAGRKRINLFFNVNYENTEILTNPRIQPRYS